MSEAPVLLLNGVTKDFHQAGEVLHILRGVDLAVHPGEIVALVGPSGAGKSTLLHIAGLLESPTGGEVIIDGAGTAGLGDRERTRIRRSALGFIYQFHHLLPEFTALENVVLPQLIAGVARPEAEARASTLLTQLGLAERLTHRPAQLSGGEQQRVAIMRALANQPKILLADEPTGNLDDATSGHVMMELMTLVREHRVAAVIATHNRELAARMDRCMSLREGVLTDITGQGGG